MVRNIRAILARATAEEVSTGVGWYPTARHGCDVWSAKYHVDARTIASVIAALSPQCEWMQNLRAALNLVSGEYVPFTGPSRPLGANVAKARAILRDGALLPDAYFKEGYKVRSFARNLQGDYSAVTVDTHAAQIALGDPIAKIRSLEHAKPYAAVGRAYLHAASLESIEPAEIQAITWLAWKRIYSPGRKRTMLRKADA